MKMLLRGSSHNLTPLYCLHQAAISFAYAGISSFAVAYLMSKGFDTALIGVMLAVTSILSCFLQPILGSYVDRRSMTLVPKLILGFLVTVMAAMGAVEMLSLPQTAIGLLFTAGYFSFLMAISFNNSLCAYYSQNGYHIDYGMGTGMGAFSFSLGSLGSGYLAARLGVRWAMIGAIALIVLDMLVILSYPRIRPEDEQVTRMKKDSDVESLSIPAFCKRYWLFMLTIAGTMCFAACHAMMESFLIQIVGRVGGDSGNVGVALFLAGLSSAPFLLCFERIQRRINPEALVRCAGLFFILKAFLILRATSIPAIYFIYMLQTCTYGFVAPVLYYLVMRRVEPADMAKGQLTFTALYTLGGGIGNSAGGAAIEYNGLNAMLVLVMIFAATGMLLVNGSLCQSRK